MATRVYADDFEVKVLKNTKPVLVDFYSDSCVACKKLAPTLCDIEEDFEARIDIFKINTNYDEGIAAEYGVKSNPTLVLFKEGKVVDKIIGAKDFDEISDWLDERI